jgi:hypothetical protein
MIEQGQIMWPVNGSQHDDFLSTPRTGKLPDFQRIASGCFSSQPKNTHYSSSFSQVIFILKNGGKIFLKYNFCSTIGMQLI